MRVAVALEHYILYFIWCSVNDCSMLKTTFRPKGAEPDRRELRAGLSTRLLRQCVQRSLSWVCGYRQEASGIRLGFRVSGMSDDAYLEPD